MNMSITFHSWKWIVELQTTKIYLKNIPLIQMSISKVRFKFDCIELTCWVNPCAFNKFPRLLCALTCIVYQKNHNHRIQGSFEVHTKCTISMRERLTRWGFRWRAWRQHSAASLNLPFRMYALARLDHASQKFGHNFKTKLEKYKLTKM